MAKKEEELDKETDMQTEGLAIEEGELEEGSDPSFVFPIRELVSERGQSSFDPFSSAGSDDDEDLGEMISDLEESQIRSQVEDSATLNKLESSIYGQKGAFGKLFHINSAGEATFYTKIKELKRVADDVDEYVLNIIKRNADWPGGHWLLRVHDSKGKVKRNIDMHFPEKPNVPSSSSDAVATSAIKQNAEMFEKFLMLTQQNKQDLTPTLLEFLKESKDKGNDTESFIKMLAIMKEMNQPKQTNSELMTALVTVGIPVVGKILENMMKPKKEFDVLQTIQALKEMTGEKPESSFKSAMGMVAQMMDTVQSMQPAQGNPWSEALKQIIPHAGTVLGNISGTFKELAQLKREALALQVNSLHGRRELPGPGTQSIPEGAMPISSAKQMEDTANMNPIMKKIYDAILTNDTSFYPELESIIEKYMDNGDRIVEGLIVGTISVENFVTNIATMVPQFNTPEMKAQMIQYMEGFVLQRLDEYKANAFLTQCDKCGNRVEFNSEQDYKEDEEQGVCGKDGCDGMLQSVVAAAPEAVAEAPVQEVEAEAEPEQEAVGL